MKTIEDYYIETANLMAIAVYPFNPAGVAELNQQVDQLPHSGVYLGYTPFKRGVIAREQGSDKVWIEYQNLSVFLLTRPMSQEPDAINEAQKRLFEAANMFAYHFGKSQAFLAYDNGIAFSPAFAFVPRTYDASVCQMELTFSVTTDPDTANCFEA